MAVGAPIHQGNEDAQDQARLVKGEAPESLAEASAHSGAGPGQELAWSLHQTCDFGYRGLGTAQGTTPMGRVGAWEWKGVQARFRVSCA